MKQLKYKVIKSRDQYNSYCKILQNMACQNEISPAIEDEIELMTILIEKFDFDNNSFETVDPITMLKSMMESNDMKPKDLVEVLGVSKGLVSDILNFKKGLSKEIIRKLAEYFSVHQEVFNRPYQINASPTKVVKNRTGSKKLTFQTA